MNYDRDDDIYAGMVEDAMDERMENEAIIESLGFSKAGGFARNDYPIYRNEAGETVIMSHQQSYNYVYVEAEGVWEKLKKERTFKVGKVSMLL